MTRSCMRCRAPRTMGSPSSTSSSCSMAIATVRTALRKPRSTWRVTEPMWSTSTKAKRPSLSVWTTWSVSISSTSASCAGSPVSAMSTVPEIVGCAPAAVARVRQAAGRAARRTPRRTDERRGRRGFRSTVGPPVVAECGGTGRSGAADRAERFPAWSADDQAGGARGIAEVWPGSEAAKRVTGAPGLDSCRGKRNSGLLSRAGTPVAVALQIPQGLSVGSWCSWASTASGVASARATTAATARNRNRSLP